MATIEDLHLTKEQETLFLTLCGKALDYRSKNAVLNDHTANDIVEKSGYGHLWKIAFNSDLIPQE